MGGVSQNNACVEMQEEILAQIQPWNVVSKQLTRGQDELCC